jgi:hypothetical protein
MRLETSSSLDTHYINVLYTILLICALIFPEVINEYSSFTIVKAPQRAPGS